MKRADAEILTVDDLAELFGCDKETAAARLTSGDLPGVKVGRGWIIPRQALFERLNEKARHESEMRRSNNKNLLEEANETRKIKNTPTALIANRKLGRKRREPPPLPNLHAEIKK
ncbi:helix-turn-helix domain-containing protein [Delftia acidovorans]|uniref:helix-turn-helix domain-containing protein n=1 Tax=Delftia acidovorans TaxID=80866 RepID=UPI002FDD4F69